MEGRDVGYSPTLCHCNNCSVKRQHRHHNMYITLTSQVMTVKEKFTSFSVDTSAWSVS